MTLQELKYLVALAVRRKKRACKAATSSLSSPAQKIANIYDYTYALDAVKIGKPVKMIVERNGQRVTLTVTPEARK